MLRTNLSTRPFYNERAVRIGIGLVVVLVAALTTFNALQILSLNGRNAEMVARAEAAEARAAELRDQARTTRQSLDKEEVSVVQAASREANLLIERRAFSWTDLFNRVEETLPADVRIVAVQPQIDEDGRMLVAMTTLARRFEDLSAFVERLEETGTFSGILSRQQEAQEEDNMLRAVIQGYYNPERRTAVEAPAASESDKAPGNTPGNAPPAGPPAPGVER
jgi:hypothetical protein